MAPLRAEKLAKKRVAERKRRQKIQADPVRLAIENQKRRKRYAEKKKKTKPLSERAKRHRRKKWALSKRIQRAKKKAEQTSAEATNSSNKSIQAITGMKIRKRNQSKLKNYCQKLESKVTALERRVGKYKMRYRRIQIKCTPSKSPRSCVSRELKRDKEKVSPKVKRRLIFATALLQDLQDSYGSKSKKQKREFSRNISLKFIIKYRFMNEAKPFFPVDMRYRRSFGVKKKNMSMVAKSVIEFLEDDDNSTLAPGKKDCITKKKVRKQKRYLNHPMQYLHQRYCQQNNFAITYSAFCKLRPFWIVWKRVQERDTCVCMKHENIELVFKRLKDESILKYQFLDVAIESDMCCADLTNECILRKCELCCSKVMVFPEFDGSAETHYDVWEAQSEMSEKHEKTFRKTVKHRVDCTLYELVQHFLQLLPDYMTHLGNIRHQTSYIKSLKESLKENDLLLHVDFSENYACKFGREPQAIHFGGNRQQICLHTVMSYNGDLKKAYCTVSEDLNHGPVAIFEHFKPIFDEYVGRIDNLYVLSDSPSSQYRNRTMFYVMFNYIIPYFNNLKHFQWNYSESGHSKGAPDGIGASVKRSCDHAVAYGVDVSNFEKFFNFVDSRKKKVAIIPINATNPSMQDDVKKAPAIKGNNTLL